jgi:hypothetical protein
VRHPGDFDFTNPPGHRDHYRNQPRVPAGHREGGQWTDGKDRQLSKLRLAFNDRDPVARTSPPQIPSPPQTPQMPSPPLQPRAPSSSPQPRIPSRPPSRWGRGGSFGAALSALFSQRFSDSAILDRYDQLSEDNNDTQQAVLYLGRVFGRDPTTGQFRLLDAEMLTREKIDELCDGGVEALQKLIDKAVTETMLYRDRLSPSQYGTDVHSKVEHKIKFNTEDRKNPKGFIPEISFVKMSEEAQGLRTLTIRRYTGKELAARKAQFDSTFFSRC